MSFSIAGKTAIVTGAGNGVGLAIARAFVDAGARVVMADLDEDALHREAGQLATDDGPVRIFAGDLREKLTVNNLLALAGDAFGRIDILVNAARHIAPTDPLSAEDHTLEDLLEQNLLTAYRMSTAVARRMIRQAAAAGDDGPAGSIVNISSIAARRTHPDLLAWSVSAAALDQMTRSLAVALAPKRIRVNAVAYGSVMSAGLRGLIREHEEVRDEILHHTPLARIASPAEVADAVQYLACEGSAFVTGQVITVDGGRTLIDPAAVAAH